MIRAIMPEESLYLLHGLWSRQLRHQQRIMGPVSRLLQHAAEHEEHHPLRASWQCVHGIVHMAVCAGRGIEGRAGEIMRS